MIEGVEISFMILETSDGSHRISLRSSGNYSINDVANYFDGGGHKYAAGARIKDMITKDVEKAISEVPVRLTKLQIHVTLEMLDKLKHQMEKNHLDVGDVIIELIDERLAELEDD